MRTATVQHEGVTYRVEQTAWGSVRLFVNGEHRPGFDGSWSETEGKLKSWDYPLVPGERAALPLLEAALVAGAP